MKHNVYCIYDSAAKAFLPPFHLPRDEMATRAFSDCVNSPTHNFHAHSEDYTLYKVAVFDDQTGEYTNSDPCNINLGNGLRFKKQPTPDLFNQPSQEPSAS